MTRSNHGLRGPLRMVAAVAVAVGLALTGAGVPRPASAADPALPAWDGGIDLYRAGTFTTQKSWLWCTATGVQIVRNIVDHQEDHSTSGQRRYFNWMREHNRYTLPLSAGVDPQGWTAGLRHFVDDRYRLVASTTFDSALRSAVKRLRLTNLPVALLVSHGNHGWILTGFTATADPSTTSSFKVTSVRIVGPLYGLQSRNGYDMPPDTKLTPTQLKRYFTPWKYAPKRMIWDGRYVSIQPVPAAAASAAPAGSTAPSAEPSAAAMATSAATPSATRSASSASENPLAVTIPSVPPGPVEPDRTASAAGSAVSVAAAFVVLSACLAALAILVARTILPGDARRGAGSGTRVPR